MLNLASTHQREVPLGFPSSFCWFSSSALSPSQSGKPTWWKANACTCMDVHFHDLYISLYVVLVDLQLTSSVARAVLTACKVSLASRSIKKHVSQPSYCTIERLYDSKPTNLVFCKYEILSPSVCCRSCGNIHPRSHPATLHVTCSVSNLDSTTSEAQRPTTFDMKQACRQLDPCMMIWLNVH